MEFYQMSADLLPSIHFVDEAVIEPPYVHYSRCAGEYILYVIKYGDMWLMEDGVPLQLHAGDICLLDKGRTHVGTQASVCDYYYIHFMHRDIQFMESETEEAMNVLLSQRQSALESDIFSYSSCENNKLYLPKHWHVSNTEDWIKINELLKTAIQEQQNPLENYKILCACHIQQAFVEISRSFLSTEKEHYISKLPSYYSKVQEILEWLNREYAGTITGEVLERELGGNFDYMNRTFKKVTGQTIFQYLTHIRMNHAKMLLIHTPLRMGEVGERVGFPDEYYFNRVFKKSVGMPPAAYARTYRRMPFEEK